MGLKKYLNPKNIAAIAASPFTAGASLALLNDGDGNSILGEFTGSNSAKKANKQNMALQRETNQMSINLANTAHQREVADLEAAGLNPILSAGGSGAATPTLGTAQVQNTMPGGLIGQATQIAQIANLAGTAKQATAQAELNKVNTVYTPQIAESEIQKNQADAYKTLIDSGLTEAQIKNAGQEYNVLKQQVATAKSAEELNKAKTDLQKWENEHPMLVHLWAPMATAVAGGVAGGLSGGFMGGLMGGINSAKQHQYKMTEKSLQLNSGGIDPKSLGIGI